MLSCSFAIIWIGALVRLAAVGFQLKSWEGSLQVGKQRILLILLLEAVCSLKTPSQCVPYTC